MLTDYRLRQREYLLEISRAMTARLDLPSLLQLIIQSTVEMLSGRAGLIALRQKDGSFRVEASYGVSGRADDFFSPLFSDIPGLGSHLDPLRWTIPNLERKFRQVAGALGIGLTRVVALPMTIEAQLIGVVFIFRTGGIAFSQNDRQLLASFADQAAIAVHNARLYQQMSQEKAQLDAIIEHSGDGVMILEPDRRIRIFNRALAAMSAIPAEEAVGRVCYDVLHLENVEPPGVDLCDETSVPIFHSANEHLYVEGDIRRDDGSVVNVGITYSPLLNRQGELTNIIASVRDITRFREAEEMKSTFISVISHELKTPVALIKGYAGTLSREDAEWDRETVRESLAVVEEEADRLTELIDNLLDVSRLQAGALKLEVGFVNVARLAEETVEKFRSQTSGHTFALDFPPDLPIVPGDEGRLRQVIDNLLSNAIKYSPDGGQIRVSGRADDLQVYVAVTDEGIGIPEDEQENIFDRFYRVRSGVSQRTKGAGVGLFLVKAVVEAHGGQVWVESKPGQGSTFVFTLPREQEQEGGSVFHKS
jgi:PAS domain S-box-containing protein